MPEINKNYNESNLETMARMPDEFAMKRVWCFTLDIAVLSLLVRYTKCCRIH